MEEKQVQKNTKPQERKKNFRKNVRGPRKERVRQEFDNKVIDMRRVTRVTSGGRRFGFSVSLVVGDRKGRVGVGIGKAGDTALAIEKAMRDAKGKLISVPLTKNRSIAHEVSGKYSSSMITMFPTPGKGGISAGSSVRIVLDLLGAKDTGSKIFSRSKNKLNIAKATIKALSKLEGVKKVTRK